jgi:ABC-type dipeptide/oligopeptide/nickel transport system ATPase component
MVIRQTALLSVRNLKTYFPHDEGTVKAVDGAAFDLFPGQMLGIVGESGCGKSITARSILGIIDRPGRIVDGEIMFRRQKGGNGIQGDDVVDLSQAGIPLPEERGDQLSNQLSAVSGSER